MNTSPDITPQTRKRALAYIRISSARQVNGESPETQRSSIERYAESNNIEIADWFYDEAKSGKNADRAELQNLLKQALKQRGKIDHVIVYKMNRASRDIDSYITGFRMKLASSGITVRSATEQFDDSPMGHFMEIFHVMVGQMDNENKRDFTVDNMTSLAFQGYWQHPPLLGYSVAKVLNDVGKSRPTLKQNNIAPLVKQVLERFSQGDISKAELTRYAAEVGLYSRYGKKLSQDSINRLIKTPTYAGYVADNFTKYELVEGKHPPIISKDVFKVNQTLLYGANTKKGEIRQQNHPDYPLKGIIRCPNCKNALYASAPKTGAGGKSPRYHCSRVTCKGKVRSVKASVMHDSFNELLKNVKPEESILKLYKEVLIDEVGKHLGSLNGRISRLRRELDVIADSRIKAIKKYSDDMLTLDEKNQLVDGLDNDKFHVTGQLSDLIDIQKVQEADIDLAVNVMEQVDKQWEVSSLDSQQRFQSMLFPEGLTYDYQSGRFGTTMISPLYRYTPNKKDSEESSHNDLVAGVGFEPTTLWL